jgi:hypothetical protein
MLRGRRYRFVNPLLTLVFISAIPILILINAVATLPKGIGI